jgi:uncharacterized pyridoxamine 5'-phosphate oxidase family protein
MLYLTDQQQVSVQNVNKRLVNQRIITRNRALKNIYTTTSNQRTLLLFIIELTTAHHQSICRAIGLDIRYQVCFKMVFLESYAVYLRFIPIKQREAPKNWIINSSTFLLILFSHVHVCLQSDLLNIFKPNTFKNLPFMRVVYPSTQNQIYIFNTLTQFRHQQKYPNN